MRAFDEWVARRFEALMLLLMAGVVAFLLPRVEWSVGWDTWPAYVGLGVALVVVGGYHRATKRKD